MDRLTRGLRELQQRNGYVSVRTTRGLSPMSFSSSNGTLAGRSVPDGLSRIDGDGPDQI